jgi:hypothetical protein
MILKNVVVYGRTAATAISADAEIGLYRIRAIKVDLLVDPAGE